VASTKTAPVKYHNGTIVVDNQDAQQTYRTCAGINAWGDWKLWYLSKDEYETTVDEPGTRENQNHEILVTT
jgi:hypothetical protein